MSTAHRPTWDPAAGKADTKGASRQYSTRDMAAHTKLKFRKPGQTSHSDVQKRDLRAELLRAEAEAADKKRKAAGLPPLALQNGGGEEGESKRRKMIEAARGLDEDEEAPAPAAEDKGKGKAPAQDDDEDSDEDEDEEESDEDSEDETAELLRELEKIKRERAEEKERQEREASAAASASREAEVARGNPLLNLANALGTSTPGDTDSDAASSVGSFAVKRRWDDDLIFKNQATGSDNKGKKEFVNDLLRTEFHRKFMSRFIK